MSASHSVSVYTEKKKTYTVSLVFCCRDKMKWICIRCLKSNAHLLLAIVMNWTWMMNVFWAFFMFRHKKTRTDRTTKLNHIVCLSSSLGLTAINRHTSEVPSSSYQHFSDPTAFQVLLYFIFSSVQRLLLIMVVASRPHTSHNPDTLSFFPAFWFVFVKKKKKKVRK